MARFTGCAFVSILLFLANLSPGLGPRRRRNGEGRAPVYVGTRLAAARSNASMMRSPDSRHHPGSIGFLAGTAIFVGGGMFFPACNDTYLA